MSHSFWSSIILAPALLLLPAFHATGQTVTTLLTNGPSERRINIVFLSEGYRTNQLAQFISDANTALNNLLSASPFSEYANYFNARAISVASVESGSDHPPGTLKDTYFNSSFNSFGNASLLTIPPNNFDNNFNHGKGKVLNLLTNLAPDYDVVVLIVNDLQYGGSGDTALTNAPVLSVTSINPTAYDIIAHELGHSLGDLADEYTTPFPGFVPVEKPNATTQTNRALVKWNAWIDPGTPVPTPPIATYFDSIGVFEGAEYQASGWYRPKLDCKMNHLGVPFCEVCSEQLVKSIGAMTGGIDSAAPVSTNLMVFGTQAINFAVAPMRPANHNLSVQWLTNNTAVTGATENQFQLLPKTLGNGTHTVKVVVSDNTSLVRNDPASVLKSSNSWTLNISLNELAIASPEFLNAGRFRFTITGAAPQGFVIQASTNLSNWLSLSTNSLNGGRFDFTNSDATGFQWRFYRTVSPP